MSKIQWTDKTWNPVIGCRRVSEGCRNCYAETQAARIVAMQHGAGRESDYARVVEFDDSGNPRPRWNGHAVFLPDRLDQPLRWTKPRLVFVNSMSDLFHEDLTFEQIAAVFGVMAAASRHTFQVLTKRPERALAFFEWLRQRGDTYRQHSELERCIYAAEDKLLVAVGDSFWTSLNSAWLTDAWPLPNVWLGVSAEDQATADERIPLLLQCPAAVRFVSAEPLLGPIEFGEVALHGAFDHCPDDDDECNGCAGYSLLGGDGCSAVRGPSLDWIIVGGESGKDARVCDVAWIRDIVAQCKGADVACFVKQLGSWPFFAGSVLPDARLLLNVKGKGGNPDEWPEDLRVREWPAKMGGHQ